MGFYLILAYVVLSFLSPADVFPGIEAFRPLLILLLLGVVVSVMPMLSSMVLSTVWRQCVMVILFLAAIMFSRVPQRWFSGTLYALNSMMPDVCMYFFGVIHFRSLGRLKILRWSLVLTAAFILAMGISQISTVRMTGTETPYVMGGYGGGGLMVRLRGLGLLHDPNHLGQLFVILLPMLLVAHKTHPGLRKSRAAYPFIALLLLGIYLTNSRGTQLGVLLFLALLLRERLGRMGSVLSLAFAPVAVVLINATRDRSIAVTSGVDRLMIWSDGLSYFKGSPVWGIGFNSFADRQGMTAHNSFLLCAAELGMLGFFFWMAMIVVTVLQLRKVSAVGAAGVNPELGQWARALTWSIYLYLFTGFFLSRTYAMPLYLLIGMGGAIIAMAGGERKLPRINVRWPFWTFGLACASLVATYIMVRLRAI